MCLQRCGDLKCSWILAHRAIWNTSRALQKRLNLWFCEVLVTEYLQIVVSICSQKVSVCDIVVHIAEPLCPGPRLAPAGLTV